DARAYAAWLDLSGTLRGARLRTFREWQRAARGADERRYPHGDELAPDDACTLLTFGGDRSRAEPCIAGSHPASASLFGVEDMVGSLWEIAANPASPAGIDLGGGYSSEGAALSTYTFLLSARVEKLRTDGIRICADYSAGASAQSRIP